MVVSDGNAVKRSDLWEGYDVLCERSIHLRSMKAAGSATGAAHDDRLKVRGATLIGPLQPVERQTLATVVLRRLMEFIDQGSLQPGDPLPPQHELARRLSVSRTVLREAMQGLASLGVIEIRPGSGCYVQERERRLDTDALLEAYTHEAALEVIEARMVIEVELAGLAALRATDDDLQRLEASLARIKRATARGRPTFALTAEFHRLLARTAHNGVLYRLAQLLRRPTLAEGVRVERELPDVAAHEHETHVRLYLAIRDRDEAAARRLMREHLETAHGWEQEIASLRAARQALSDAASPALLSEEPSPPLPSNPHPQPVPHCDGRGEPVHSVRVPPRPSQGERGQGGEGS
jgi:GntR family transcriptional repressor for pyruvate dehydrogenase complex